MKLLGQALFILCFSFGVGGSPSRPFSNQQETVFQFYPPEALSSPLRAYASAEDTRPLGEALEENGKLYVQASQKFSLTVMWYVRRHGFLWLKADRDLDLYDPQRLGDKTLQLNFELALSRIRRNQRILEQYKNQGLRVSSRIRHFEKVAERYLDLASQSKGEVKARISDLALSRAVDASEALELSWARYQSEKSSFKPPLIGVDSRHFFWTNITNLDKYFSPLFDFATITHYLKDDWFPPFEPKEGDLRWGAREEIYRWLKNKNVVIEARPVLWLHESVSPDWLAKKKFQELKAYAVTHARLMVKHWGDRVTYWEVANEMHDWANVNGLTPSQITELIRVTAHTIRQLQPQAKLIINSTNIFGNAVGLEAPYGGPAKRRNPYLFIRDLVEAGVDFDVIGLQLYEPERDLSEMVRQMELFESFGKEIMITEMGVSSYYDYEEPTMKGQTEWSETAQAQWAEDVFRVLGARSSIRVLCWYDLTDTRSFIHNGGLLTQDGEPKEVYSVLLSLKKEWYRVKK